jgi:cell wall-associated NlpC family hydrolase
VTFTDMVSAIQQIQSQLATLSSTPGSADSGAAFADALSGASTTTEPTKVSTTASTDGSLIDADGVTGADVVKDAEKYLGVPYVFGGESSSGMDCSGLVQKTFSDLGISVPRLVHEQKTVGQSVGSLKDAKPGDLIVLNGGDHIAIYAGNGMVVHAPYEGRTVSLQKDWFTDKDIVTIRRIVPATGDPTAAAGGGASAATTADVAALSAMLDGSSSSSLGSTGSGGTSLSSLLSTLGAGGSSSTAQQLLAARAAIAGGVA